MTDPRVSSKSPGSRSAAAVPSLIALLHGPDQRGLVARVAGWIFERGGNIIHADQHRDAEANVFFQRIEWDPAPSASEGEAEAFGTFARNDLSMDCIVAAKGTRTRIGCFVSRYDHCFHDLLLRVTAGEIPAEVVCVISNHEDLGEAAARYGVPFHYVPVSRETRIAAETRQLAIFNEAGAELVVLARYMQILSDGFLAALKRPVINIHHSFLPAFAGGHPYRQAHHRGVKLIGATAHYATADLDEGPIIHQDVTRVSHRNSVADLTRRGRDLEKMVFAQAVRWHCENRILVYNNKTVVFD